MAGPEPGYPGDDEESHARCAGLAELANLLAIVGRWRRRYAERVTLYETHIASLFDRIDSLQKAVTDQQAMINRAAIERADREDELGSAAGEAAAVGGAENRARQDAWWKGGDVSISIVIPVYDGAQMTKVCLDALIAMNLGAEIIVVDDASADDTSALLRSYGAAIMTRRNERNRGYAYSCNRGAELATGEFLLLLNNDTVPWEGFLDELVAAAKNFPKRRSSARSCCFPTEPSNTPALRSTCTVLRITSMKDSRLTTLR